MLGRQRFRKMIQQILNPFRKPRFYTERLGDGVVRVVVLHPWLGVVVLHSWLLSCTRGVGLLSCTHGWLRVCIVDRVRDMKFGLVLGIWVGADVECLSRVRGYGYSRGDSGVRGYK